MSDTEIIALAQKVASDAVLSTLQAFGIKSEYNPYISFNYALKLLKPHRFGRRKLERVMMEGRVDWKQPGRNILIKRETLKNLY